MDLDRLLDSIELDDLQIILQEYVKKQESNDKVTSMFFATKSISGAIGTDCTKFMMGYLSFSDLFPLSRANKEFNALCAPHFDHELLCDPVFEEYFGHKKDDQFRIGYLLQNKYSTYHLNGNSFEEMGKKGLLKGDDLVIWALCHHHGFKTSLLRWVDDEGLNGIHCEWETTHSDGMFKDDGVGSDWDDWCGDDDLDAVHGKGRRGEGVPAVPETTLTVYHRGVVDYECYQCPMVKIICPDNKWRSAFLSRVANQK